ncbi:MAG: protein-glutamate O-methyltransferase [Acidobacteria bacterium]|nr:MAG: protein-glutamate O-methyltransferase [Acidobacteriota bacterium]
MTAAIGAREIERFRAALAARLGLHFDEGKFGFLAEVLGRRVEAAGQGSEAYLSRLETRRMPDEVAALAREVTIPETYFFRNLDQYRAFAEIVLPDRLAAPTVGRRLRILSLGCASGEEAYSLAILVRDMIANPACDVSIVGVDVNSAMIEKANRGRFSAWALRETPEEDRRRWFRADGPDFILDDAVRTSVRFEQRNLIDDDPQLWQSSTYDVVFFRNVVMYFTPDQGRRVVDRIARALCPGGYLFLGHAETLRGFSNDFHLRHTHGTFYYQRKERAESLSSASFPSDVRHPPIASIAAVPADADSWVDAIRRASERVAALTDSHRPDPSGLGSNVVTATPAWELGLVLELLRKERFAEALAIVNAFPPASGRDPDVLLLRAVLLTHGGQLARAEDACARLLDVDDLSAGAHYLLALCREGAGDRAAASHHDQVAAYLDPGFAMPRLHLGLLARGVGEHSVAREQLGQALVLLQREDASRVLLFGGGFGREALIALCRTELLRCGGTA